MGVDGNIHSGMFGEVILSCESCPFGDQRASSLAQEPVLSAVGAFAGGATGLGKACKPEQS